jgi:hypothetical protein
VSFAADDHIAAFGVAPLCQSTSVSAAP